MEEKSIIQKRIYLVILPTGVTTTGAQRLNYWMLMQDFTSLSIGLYIAFHRTLPRFQ